MDLSWNSLHWEPVTSLRAVTLPESPAMLEGMSYESHLELDSREKDNQSPPYAK